MAMGDRVLISCTHVFDQMDWVGPELESHGIHYDLADVQGQQLSEPELLSIVSRYDGILAGDDEITAKVLAAGERLRVVAKWGIGVDNIDLETAERLGIMVTNTPGVFGDEIADYALGYLMLLLRHQHVIDRETRQGKWPKLRGRSAAGLTLGIIGLGSSGRALARRAAVMGMRLVGYDIVAPDEDFLVRTSLRCTSVAELLEVSDVVSLHTPLTDENRHMIDDAALRRMRPESYLINTARGGLVDQAALVAALRDRRIAGAALDVFEEEPLDAADSLCSLTNVVLGSHNASNTSEAVVRTTEKAVANLTRELMANHG